jgi:hypothetical protein
VDEVERRDLVEVDVGAQFRQLRRAVDRAVQVRVDRLRRRKFGYFLYSLRYIANAAPICFRLLWQATALADERTLFKAGKSIDTSNAMMAMTTSSSTSVNALTRE